MNGAARPLLRASMLALLLCAVLAWSGGFLLFAWRATRPPGALPRADGIVVLTGGAGRIEAALGLLESGRARLLLISGVSPRLDLDGVLRASGLRPPEPPDLAPPDLAPPGLAPPGLAGRIMLGHVATDTLGNAIETADWAHANGLHSLIVVTAGYHMQRALAEIGAALPDVGLSPYPVLPPALLRPGSLSTLRLLVSEYDKWLLVASGLGGAAHLREIA